MVVADMPVVTGPSVRLSLVKDVGGGLVVDQDSFCDTPETSGIRHDPQVHDDSEGSDVDSVQVGVEVDTSSEPDEIDDIILDVLDALADADADANAGAGVDDGANEGADDISHDVVCQVDQVVPGE